MRPEIVVASESTVWVQRARPLLGTLVILRASVLASAQEQALQAMEQAFGLMAEVQRCMSAHCTDSDLARIARCAPGQTLEVSVHTVRVLQKALHWWRLSRGALDPVRAAHALSRQGLRPGLCDASMTDPLASLQSLEFLDEHSLVVHRPVRIDLGGIAKGYAVDLACERLNACGVEDVLVNAGGDLRASGDRDWPVEIRDAHCPTRTQRLRGLKSIRRAALATSVSEGSGSQFVRTLRGSAHRGRWTRCSVLARDALTADALTKWGLQCGPQGVSPRLHRILHAHGARMWIS